MAWNSLFFITHYSPNAKQQPVYVLLYLSIPQIHAYSHRVFSDIPRKNGISKAFNAS